ncbi:hypothetical protein [Flavobacterium beibuense]|uniref:hypothetical protein n=1 Tax=Flavobacterium beibuense TaxID=657326 RepID=UPI003A9565E2
METTKQQTRKTDWVKEKISTLHLENWKANITEKDDHVFTKLHVTGSISTSKLNSLIELGLEELYRSADGITVILHTLVPLTKKELIDLWGKKLYEVFEKHIDKQGWLTEDWPEIIEKEIKPFDEDWNDNPQYKDTYQRMYNVDWEVKSDGLFIRPMK